MNLLAGFGDFHFLRPLWLLALLLLPIAAWWWRRQSQRRNVWRDVVDAHLLPHLLDAEAASPRRAWAGGLALAGFALAVVALAGPSLRKDEHPLWQTEAPLIIALDLSNTILARDLAPTRLAQARAKLATLLRERAGGQVALVVFADDAFTVAPLTEDTANVALFLDALTPDIMPSFGRSIEAPRVDRAITWSQGLMRQAGFERGEILLLTDRADGTDNAAASNAAAAGYRVSVLGLGTVRGGVYATPGGGVEQARLDAPALKRLAASGGGRYAALSMDDGDLKSLGVLDPQDSAGMAARGEKVASWRDDGYWLLPLVMLLCLPLFRRNGMLVALLACTLLLPMSPAYAQAVASGGSLWRRADQVQHQRMQDGIEAYRSKDYPRAIEQFTGIDSPDGHYNLGNALAKAGRYDDAIAAYDRALEQQPGMTDAILNRKAVELARKLPKQQGQQGQDGKQQPQQPGESGKSDARSGDGDSRQQKDAHDPKPQPSQPPEPSRQQGQQDAQPQDAGQQQQADAAQRQRMQEAMRQQQGEKGKDQATEERQGKAEETPEQRERRLANQAWLQRVPDDPGALLRARFRLEAERRRGGGQ